MNIHIVDKWLILKCYGTTREKNGVDSNMLHCIQGYCVLMVVIQVETDLPLVYNIAQQSLSEKYQHR